MCFGPGLLLPGLICSVFLSDQSDLKCHGECTMVSYFDSMTVSNKFSGFCMFKGPSFLQLTVLSFQMPHGHGPLKKHTWNQWKQLLLALPRWRALVSAISWAFYTEMTGGGLLFPVSVDRLPPHIQFGVVPGPWRYLQLWISQGLETPMASRSWRGSWKRIVQLCEYKHVQVHSVPVGSSTDVFKVKTASKDQH